MTIKSEQYEKIQDELMASQATKSACVLIVLDDENLKWLSATNSSYETMGMVQRVLSCIDSKSVVVEGVVKDV